MLMFAFSLIHSAIYYSRRQRLNSILFGHIRSPDYASCSFICRITAINHLGSDDHSHTSRNGNLYKASSEPIVSQNADIERVIFNNEDREIVLGKAVFVIQPSEWVFTNMGENLLPFFFKRIVSNRINFVLRLLPVNNHKSRDHKNDGGEDWPSSTRFMVADFAKPIAYSKEDKELQLFECNSEQFIALVLAWAENSLYYNPDRTISEIFSVKLPSADSRPSTSTDFLINQSELNDRLETSSRCSSPNTNNSDSCSFGKDSLKSYSLLEVLFRNEMFEMGPFDFGPTGLLNRGLAFYHWQNERNYSTISSTKSGNCSFNLGGFKIHTYPNQVIPNYIFKMRERRRYCSLNNSPNNNTPLTKKLQKIISSECIPQQIDGMSKGNDTNNTGATTVLDEYGSNNSSEIGRTKRCDKSISFSTPHSELNANNLPVQGKSSITPAEIGFDSECEMFNNQFSRVTMIEEKLHRRKRDGDDKLNAQRRCFTSLRSVKIGETEGPSAEASNDAQKIRVGGSTGSVIANFGPYVCYNYEPHSNCFQKGSYNPSYYRRFHSLPRRRRITVNMENNTLQKSFISNGSITKIKSDGQTSSNEAKNLQKPSQKPPSLLIYTGDNFELYDQIASCLRNVLQRDTYTIGHLSTDALLKHPWFNHSCACLLIADTSRLNDQAWTRLQSYFVNSGKFLFVCENTLLSNLTNCNSTKKRSNMLKSAFGNKSLNMALGKDFEKFLKKTLKGLSKNKEFNETYNAKDLVGGSRYSVILCKKKDQPLLLYMQNWDCHACALFSDASTEDLCSGSIIFDTLTRLGIKLQKQESGSQIPELTKGYLVCIKESLILRINELTYTKLLGSRPSLQFYSSLKNNNTSEVTSGLLPIEVCRRKTWLQRKFDCEAFFGLLNTKTLGHVLIYVPVCQTTLNVSRSLSEAFPGFDGILVVAGTQIGGKGRRGNDWISPEGSALFTFNFNVPADSELGRSITFLQHILAVSMVDAVLTLLDDAKCLNFPLKIKWPNDVYYGRVYKIGGAMVQATHRNGWLECLVAGGLNISNSKPTVCINDMLPDDSIKKLSVEEFLAQTMNKFEEYVNLFVNEGKSKFCKIYYNFWLHTNEEVGIYHEESNMIEKTTIKGLDENGYLEVRNKQTGQTFSVHDNGNSFDLMKGLIHPKA